MKLIVRKVHKGKVVAAKVISYTLGIRMSLLTNWIIHKHNENNV